MKPQTNICIDPFHLCSLLLVRITPLTGWQDEPRSSIHLHIPASCQGIPRHPQAKREIESLQCVLGLFERISGGGADLKGTLIKYHKMAFCGQKWTSINKTKCMKNTKRRKMKKIHLWTTTVLNLYMLRKGAIIFCYANRCTRKKRSEVNQTWHLQRGEKKVGHFSFWRGQAMQQHLL